MSNIIRKLFKCIYYLNTAYKIPQIQINNITLMWNNFLLTTCDLSRNTIYWSNTLYKYKVQSWFSYSAVSIRTQTFGILSFDILRNVGFSFSYWSPYGCRMAALLQLHLRLTSFQIKRKKQRPFPDLACPCFFFSPLEWKTPQQVFPLSLCLELVFTRTS